MNKQQKDAIKSAIRILKLQKKNQPYSWLKADENALQQLKVALDYQSSDEFKERLAREIEKMPFGDTAASFAAFVRNFK